MYYRLIGFNLTLLSHRYFHVPQPSHHCTWDFVYSSVRGISQSLKFGVNCESQFTVHFRTDVLKLLLDNVGRKSEDGNCCLWIG